MHYDYQQQFLEKKALAEKKIPLSSFENVDVAWRKSNIFASYPAIGEPIQGTTTTYNTVFANVSQNSFRLEPKEDSSKHDASTQSCMLDSF